MTGLVGYAIPAFLSIQALESPQAGDDKQWLTYWIVSSTITVLEVRSDRDRLERQATRASR